MLDEEERTPPDVFSDLSTVLLSIDLDEGWDGGRRPRRKEEKEEEKQMRDMFLEGIKRERGKGQRNDRTEDKIREKKKWENRGI